MEVINNINKTIKLFKSVINEIDTKTVLVLVLYNYIMQSARQLLNLIICTYLLHQQIISSQVMAINIIL